MSFVEAMVLSTIICLWVLFVFFSSYVHWLPFGNDRNRYAKIALSLFVLAMVERSIDFARTPRWQQWAIVIPGLVAFLFFLFALFIWLWTAVRGVEEVPPVRST